MLYTAVLIWGVACILLGAGGSYVIYQSQQVTKQLCQVTDDNRNILQQILNVAEGQSLTRADDITERNLIRQSYNELRALIPPLKCTSQGGPQELEP